jgi:hypothetical protein
MGPGLDWTIPSTFKDHASEAHRRVQLPNTDSEQMPKEGTITDEEIKTIVCWVEQGADITN